MKRTHTVRRGAAGGPRRKLIWVEAGGNANPVGVGNAGIIFDLMAAFKTAGGDVLGSTIIRTHLVVNALTTPEISIGTQEGLDIGLIVGTTTDTVSELNATRSYDDWMLRKAIFPGTARNSMINAVATPPTVIYGDEIDLRAKRKMQELQQTYWAYFGARNGTTTAMNFFARILIALP